ncbi:MAG: hypothetical protein FCO83_00905 [Spiroplasma sp. WSS]|nr:hypothetical protein [Spiroplasma ixodetis]MBP1527945.1 hypothetical protein [Spiroplasma ixodetis]TLF27542.1 MAG: hypothetical protein FCO83_00905 [Spiroplasma sp. WSS]
MQLTNKEQEILSTYQKWIKKNNLSDKCNAYFISKTFMLVFQVWNSKEMISETIWLKSDNGKWQFYIKTLEEQINKSFLLEEILKIEKDFVLKTFKEKQNL